MSITISRRPRSRAEDAMQASGTGASLEIVGLVKRYGEALAVNNVSLAVGAGEFVTLLGPSGSGKTTTLNMIAGFVDVTSGAIRMDGGPIDTLPPHRRNIGMVFQSYALFPHLSVFENVAFPLKRRRVPKERIRQQVGEALDMVRMEEFADRLPAQLSGGQQQRVALARAIVFRPRVLLMDEPLGALDKKLREWLQLEIKRIHRELGITFIYVTHDQDEALVMSDRIAVFADGRIEQVGCAEALYDQPRTLFVAEFLGESNVLRGRVRRLERGYAVVSDQVELRVEGPDDLLAPGRGAVVVRPERVAVLDEDVDRRELNVLTGVVKEIIYLGSARKVQLELAAGQRLVVREQAGAWSQAAPGERVEVGFHPRDARALADTEALPSNAGVV
jgi:putative spermidine/putrescine transport system ATP-binding protein